MQNVLFISSEIPENYPIIDKHYKWHPIHTTLTFEEFSKLWHETKPYAIYTYGNNACWNYLNVNFEIRKRWIHLNELPTNLSITDNVFSSVIKHKYDADNPLITVITSTFHSKEKIYRPYNSLRSQTYTNWEWVVWDDSKDNQTYDNLLNLKKTDFRMRVYKAPQHSGCIGEMKRLAAGVAYGSFIVELDHDDDIHPNLLKWIVDASKKYPEVNFFYCTCAELYEKTLISHSYPDFFAYGYGAHINIWSDIYNKWITNILCAPPNPVTLKHLIGLPNHVRVWKTDFYDKIGKHNPRLTASDDYELLVKSFIHGKWCFIRECGYVQYRNIDGNFTFILNSLIQHNVHHIYDHYKSELPKIPDNYVYEPYWKYDGEKFPQAHLTYDPNPHVYSIIMLEPSKEKIEQIININASLHIYIVGECPDIPIEWRKRVSWWNLKDTTVDEKIRYIKKYIATGDTIIMDNELHLISSV